MAFPASAVALQKAFDALWQHALDLKNTALYARSILAGQSVTVTRLAEFAQSLSSKLDAMHAVASTNGLEAYARTQLGDPSINLSTEYSTMRTAGLDVVNTIVTSLPKTADAQQYLRAYKIDARGSIIEDSYTPAQTAGVVAKLDALIATIN